MNRTIRPAVMAAVAAASLASALLLSACGSTTNTVGRDVSATGAAISRAADEVKQGL